jgi:hypothetical protein
MTDNGNGKPANPQIVVEFLPDGNTQLHTSPGVGSAQMWIAARLMELMGDSQFAEAQMLAQAKRQTIAVPGKLSGLMGGKR